MALGRRRKDSDILEWSGHHPAYGEVHFEREGEDGRSAIYRLTGLRTPKFHLVTASHARVLMACWRIKG